MKILALDSSATAASVALLEDNFVLGEFFVNTKYTHSQTLVPMIKNLLNVTCVDIKDIDLFSVNVGPGSFTGIRIGVSAVKGMALALSKPCVPVSTLLSLAYNLKNYDGLICACMDARCNQVYNALFEVSGGEIKRLTDDRAILIDDLAEELKGFSKKIILVGDGAILCYNKLHELLPYLELSDNNNRYQRASSVAKIAFGDYNCGKSVKAAELLPKYIRMPQAERELKKKLSIKGE